MREFISCMLVLGTALTWPGQAQAQEQPVHPNRQQLPTDVVVDKRGNPLPIWVAYEGLKPLKKIGADKQDMKERSPFRFLQMCYYADRYTIGEDMYYLLVEIDEKANQIKQYLGWVDERYLIKEAEARRKGDTTLYKKGFLVNTVEFLELAKNDKEDPRQLTLRKAPDKTAPGDDEPHRLYSFLFIYGEAEGYYLMGNTPVFNPRLGERDAREVVLGWVSKERVCLWESREAFEWRSDNTLPSAQPRRTKPGKIYASIEKAQAAMKDPTVEALFEEVFNQDGISEPWDAVQPRFPVLRRVGVHPRGGELLEVAVMGGFHTGRGTVPDPNQVNRLRRELARIQNEITRIEILVVVDDTASMAKWFKEVAAICEDIVAPLRREGQREVHLAVAYYSDVTPGNAQPVITNRLQNTRTAGDQVIRELAAHKTRGGGDPLEMVFRGIYEGIDQAGFSAEARKIVIVLGYCGDISASQRRLAADPTYRQRYNEQAIVDRLLPENQSPIELLAIQVVDPEAEPEYGVFRSQMQAIQKLYNERLKQVKLRGRASYMSATDRKEVRAAILSRQAELEQWANALSKEINRLFRSSQRTTRIDAELKAILERKNIKMDDLLGIDGFQVFHTGYVWTRGPENLPQITERLLINDRELVILTRMLGRLRERDVEQRHDLKELLKSVIEQAAGDVYDRKGVPRPDKEKLSMETIFKKLTGLQFRSPLLNRVPDKGDVALSDDEYFRLLHQLDVLEDIRNDVRYEYEVREVSLGGRKATQWVRVHRPGRSPVAEVRRFTLPGGKQVHWYWIDFWKEWP